MEYISKNIKEIRKDWGLTQKEFAEKIFIKQGYLSSIERGKKRPSESILLAIQKVFNVSEEWLLTGKGPKRDLDALGRALEITSQLGKDEQEEFERIVLKSKLYDAIPDEIRAHLLLTSRPVPDLKVISRHKLNELERWEAFVPVALVAGHAVAEDPRSISDHDIEGYCLIYKSWCKRPGDYVCLRLSGDSMEPALPEGSIVAVHLRSRSLRALNKKLVAARHEGGVAVKELQRSGDNWFLISYNKEYPPLLIRPEEENTIIGKVAWWWARQE